MAYKIGTVIWLISLLFLAVFFNMEKDGLFGIGVIFTSFALALLFTALYLFFLFVVWLLSRKK
ncbi:hypothetical protein P9761_00460 [Brevibacillus centrosporus]|uniref:hypothetical protein n=1 Tax=Brevibacillus centrosporus TaxID=54910 RepID=UPI002E21D6BD|nr:hypothetical protein [Brevibacillus centrosporus]